MCSINYTYAGPALLVLPLFLISLVNLFVAGPPLKTIVLDASGNTYGASLPFMRLEVAGSTAKFSLTPRDEMTHFFVVSCYAAAASGGAPLALDAAVTGMKAAPTDPAGTYSLTQSLVHTTSAPPALPPSAVASAAPLPRKHPALQLLQPLLGYSQYEAVIKTASATPGSVAPPLPAIEYRLTYVPSKFTYTQICVRAFFTLTSTSMLIAYTAAICSRSKRELGQLWVTVLLVLLVALNDPLYIARVAVGGNHSMYVVSVLGQILFSGGLFLFWLVRKAHMRTRPKSRGMHAAAGAGMAWRHRSPSVLSFRPLRTCSAPAPRLTRPPPPRDHAQVYADGMSSTSTERSFCCFYLPKLLLVATYVCVSAVMFVLHGRMPDRINMSDAMHGAGGDSMQLALILALCASVVSVGLWLSALVAQAVYRLGWKKVEYIYTEREKSFVGITIVFVILSLCGHLYRAVHGRRGSWMQLQMPFSR